MTTASLELSKELYELSGWNDTDSHWIEQGPSEYHATQETYPTVAAHDDAISEYPYFKKTLAPAYDLGYVLRKLPEALPDDTYPVVSRFYRGGWAAYYEFGRVYEPSDRDYLQEANTPENAACKLAIELFKQGILTKETTQ